MSYSNLKFVQINTKHLLYTRRYNGRHNIALKNLLTTRYSSSLSILMHGVIKGSWIMIND